MRPEKAMLRCNIYFAQGNTGVGSLGLYQSGEPTAHTQLAQSSPPSVPTAPAYKASSSVDGGGGGIFNKVITCLEAFFNRILPLSNCRSRLPSSGISPPSGLRPRTTTPRRRRPRCWPRRRRAALRPTPTSHCRTPSIGSRGRDKTSASREGLIINFTYSTRLCETHACKEELTKP